MDFVPTNARKWVQAASAVIYAFVHCLTIGAMAFVILGEASSTALRAKTIFLATATQAACSIVMSFAVPYVLKINEAHLKSKVGFVFGGLAALGS